VTERLGSHAADAQLRLSHPNETEWRLEMPLVCDREAEGVLLLGGPRPTPQAVDMERLGLLTQQAALVLAHVRLFERRLREEKLALVGRMAGAICHRVRAPLARIVAAVDEVRGAPSDYVDMIRDETVHLESLCAELSDLVAGSAGLVPRPLALDQLLSTVAQRVRGDLERHGIEMVTEIEPGLGLSADEGKLTRALYNLIKNASDAMPHGGRLELRLARHGAEACLTVADSGCGMSPEVLERLFEPFFTHGKIHGTGLGGAVVRAAVTAHGGHIEVRSEVSVGTTFHIRLPLSDV
jgi:signal transduction histidine kinase